MTTISESDRAWHYRMINASIAAISIRPDSDTIPESAPGYAAMQLGEPPIAVQSGDFKINAGLVGLTREGSIIVAFRGTITPPLVSNEVACLDWTQDQKLSPVPWLLPESSEPFGYVCEGFAAATESVWDGIASAIRNYRPSRTRPIWITGHSKGGAMAVLAAPRIHKTFSLFPSTMTIVTSAAPCVGDAVFRDNYDRNGLTRRTIRYQNQHDVIPLAPKKLPVIPPSFLPDCTAIHPPVPPEPNLEYDQIGTLHYISVDNTSTYAIETDQQLAEKEYWDSVQNVSPLVAAQAHQPQGNYLNCFYGNG